MYHDLHASLNASRTPAYFPWDKSRCYAHRVEGYSPVSYGQMGVEYRSYPELFFSGALTEQQVDDMYRIGQGATTCPVARWINLGTGCAGLPIFTHTVSCSTCGTCLFFLHFSPSFDNRGVG